MAKQDARDSGSACSFYDNVLLKTNSSSQENQPLLKPGLGEPKPNDHAEREASQNTQALSKPKFGFTLKSGLVYPYVHTWRPA